VNSLPECGDWEKSFPDALGCLFCRGAIIIQPWDFIVAAPGFLLLWSVFFDAFNSC
jgi:hypothetical protein